MTILRNALNPIHWRFTKPWVGRLLVLCIMLATVAIGTMVATQMLRTTAPTPFLRGQQLAADIAAALRSDPTVAIASGTYLPDQALILYTKVSSGDVRRTRAWAQRQLEPFLVRLSQLPAQEQFTWIIEEATPAPPQPGDEDGIQQEVLTVKFSLITDPLQYQYTSNGLPPSSTTADMAVMDMAVGQADPISTGATEGAEEQPADDAPVSVAPAAQSERPASDGTTPPAALLESSAPSSESNRPSLDNPTPLRSITFTPPATATNLPSEWRSISGAWEMVNGIYRQMDGDGYDYISMLNLPPQRHYSMEVRLRMNAGDMGGGLIYNAQTLDNRAGAQIIDMDERGRYIRWGYYNADGLYTFVGGATLDVGLTDGAWHQLRLVTQGEVSSIWFDGQEVGRTTNQSSEGYLGLVTSRAQIDFDDLVITALPPVPLTIEGVGAATAPTVSITETAVVTTPTAVISTTTNLTPTLNTTTTALFRDDFNTGNTNGWQVLDGTWQFLEESYQQTELATSDLATISPFQGSDYRATVRMRLLEGNMGAGFIFNLAQPGTKKQSQLIRFYNNGRDLQWGAFDEGGNFVLQGSTRTPNVGDGAWHTLTLDLTAGRATFALDGITVARDVALTYSAGYLGLFTSQSQVAFDDLIVTPRADATNPGE